MYKSVNKTKNTSKLPKRILYIGVVVLLAAASLFVLEKLKITDFIKLSQPGSNATAQPSAEQIKQQAANDQLKKQDVVEDKTSETATPAPVPTSSDTITVTASQDSSSVIVLTKLVGFAAGECNLTAVNSSKTITQSAKVIYQPEYSSCAGFSIPVSQLGVGVWTITLQATPEGGSALSKTTSIEVK